MRITALAGGVGGAKMAQGFAAVCRPFEFSVIVNTADDFNHFGLYICPDLDTVMYTLSGLANPETGWGINHDTFHAVNSVEILGGPTWFRLGDKDLATHMERTRRLIQEKESLTRITMDFCNKLGIETNILPMCNEKVSTMVNTKEKGLITFQEYFVKYRFSLTTTGILFQGIEQASPTDEVIRAIEHSELIIFCPSNPFVSINPILALGGIKDILIKSKIIAVSPIIGGRAVKGPLDKLLVENGYAVNPASIAKIYKGLIHCLVIDEQDEGFSDEIRQSGIIPLVTDIMLPDLKQRKKLAQFIISQFDKVRKE